MHKHTIHMCNRVNYTIADGVGFISHGYTIAAMCLFSFFKVRTFITCRLFITLEQCQALSNNKK